MSLQSEIITIDNVIEKLEPIRDGYYVPSVESYSFVIWHQYNAVLDNLRILESHLRTKQHRDFCSGCDSIHHIGEVQNS